MSRLLVTLLALLTLAAGGLVALQSRSGQGFTAMPPQDFVEYWAAGRLLLNGDNPYDLKKMEPLERDAGRPDAEDAIPMLNPPFVLPLVLPFGVPPARVAQLLWLAMHFAVLLFLCDALYRHFGGPEDYRIAAVALGLTFGPSLTSIIVGQISPLLLLGAWAFLTLVRRGRDGLAGMATVLLAIKPHLCYLFWIAVLLWTLRTGRWKVIAGGVLAGLLLTAVALAFNPHVVSQYFEMMRTTPPSKYESPVFGTLLRRWQSGPHLGAFSWQYVPMLFGLGWLAGAWPRLKDEPWDDTFPTLLLMSLLTAPYGAWLFDLVLLLVPLLHLMAASLRAGRLVAPLAAAYGLVCAVILGMVLVGVPYLAFIWVTPAVLALYLGGLPLLRYRNQPHPAGPAGG
ncbi:MAG: glycosyltransferase family 87 protein [Gemmataceae bacterium]